MRASQPVGTRGTHVGPLRVLLRKRGLKRDAVKTEACDGLSKKACRDQWSRVTGTAPDVSYLASILVFSTTVYS